MAKMTMTTRRRRTWPQRFLLLCGLVLSAGLFVGAFIFFEARTVLAELPRIRVGPGVLAQGGVPGDPVNFLLVGVDSSEGLDPDDPVRQGRALEDEARGVVRPDTIVVLRLDPATGEAAVLSLPRDLIVEVPGGTTTRINATQAVGGLDSLISTVNANLSIPINHFVVADFASFADVVDIVGGVPVNFPFPTRDRGSGLAVDAGCWALNGREALAYVRSRSIEEFVDGQWVPLEAVSPDLARIERQQEFMVLAVEEVLRVARSDLSRIGEFIDAGSQAVQLDENLTAGDLLDLAAAFADYNTADLDVATLPVAALFSDDGIYQGEQLRTRQAEQILPFFQGLAQGVRPADVSVVVDTEQDRHIEELGERGFRARSGGQGSDSPTRIVLGPDDRDEALLVARYLESVPAFEVAPNAGVRLDVGPDFSGIRRFPRPDGEVRPAINNVLRAYEQAQGSSETSEIDTNSSDASSVTSLVPNVGEDVPLSTSAETVAEPNGPTTTSVPSATLVVRGRPPDGTICTATGG